MCTWLQTPPQFLPCLRAIPTVTVKRFSHKSAFKVFKANVVCSAYMKSVYSINTHCPLPIDLFLRVSRDLEACLSPNNSWWTIRICKYGSLQVEWAWGLAFKHLESRLLRKSFPVCIEVALKVKFSACVGLWVTVHDIKEKSRVMIQFLLKIIMPFPDTERSALDMIFRVMCYFRSVWWFLGWHFLWISEQILSWMLDEFIHWLKPYLLLSATSDEILSWMIEFWLKHHSISNNNCNTANLWSPNKFTRNDK